MSVLFIGVSLSVLMLWFVIQQDIHDLGVQYESEIFMFPMCEFVIGVLVSLKIIDVDVKRVSLSSATISHVFCAFHSSTHEFTCKVFCHFCYLIIDDIWLQYHLIYLYSQTVNMPTLNFIHISVNVWLNTPTKRKEEK